MMNPYALIYLFAYLAPALVGFGALILYTHLLSPAEYGVYVIGTSVAGIITAVFFTWIRLSVSRYQAASPHLDLRAESIVAYGATALLVAGLAPVAFFVVRPDVGLGFLAATLLFSLSTNAFEISQEFRRAQLNPSRFARIALMRSLLSLTLGYLAIEFGGGGVGLLAAVGASFLITNILGYQGDAVRPLRAFSPTHLTKFARFGLPLSLGALACALYNVLDRLGVAYLLGESGAGYYGLAADMTRQLIVILAGSVASAMFPLAFRSLAENGAVAARERLKEGIELLLALVAPVAIWVAVSSDVVAGTLLGSQFQANVAALLPLLVLGRVCGVINQFYVHVSYQLVEKPLLQVAHDLSILIINLALLFPLTLAFGLTGTALAVLISEAAGVLVGIALSRSAFRLPFNGRGMARVVAATAIMAVITYGAKTAASGHGLLTLFVAAAVGAGAYACAAFLLDVAGIRTSINSIRWLRRVAME